MFLPSLTFKTGYKGIIFFTLPEWNWAKDFFSLEKSFTFLNVKIKYDKNGLICGPVLGAPLLGILMESFKKLGIKQIIGVGWVGKIGQKVQIEDLFFPYKAYSLEGTTKMYFPKRKVFFPDKELYRFLKQRLKEGKISYKPGKILSVDAPFIFEKNEQIINKWKQKVECIDMETSCLFGLGEFLKIKTAALHFVIDEVGIFKNTRFEEKIKIYRKAVGKILKEFLYHEL